jgi:hypothetical protein
MRAVTMAITLFIVFGSIIRIDTLVVDQNSGQRILSAPSIKPLVQLQQMAGKE